MTRSRRLLAAALLLASATSEDACTRPRPPEAGTVSPSLVVTMLYHDHFAHGQNWEATYRRQRALFSDSLAAMLDADLRAAAANASEIVGLDFDPLRLAPGPAGWRVTNIEYREGNLVSILHELATDRQSNRKP